MANKKDGRQREKEGRGIIFTVSLLIQTFFAIADVVLAVYILLTGNPFGFDYLSSAITLAIVALLAYSTLALWQWKKTGIYAIIGLFLVWTVEFLLYELPDTLKNASNPGQQIFQEVWFFLLISVIYGWVLKRKWHLFS